MPKVLIIDDEPLTISLLQTYLSSRGFEVVSAQTGQDGLALVSIEQPDALIVDMMLPDIGGAAIIQHLRAVPTTAHTPVLVLSALISRITQEKAKQAGANVYLPKNVPLNEIVSQLNRLLDHAQ